MKRIVFIVAMVLVPLSARAQFLCSGEGWQDDQCASPYHLFYPLTSAQGAAYFDTNGMLTTDNTNYVWDEPDKILAIANPASGNTIAEYAFGGGRLAFLSHTYSVPNEYPDSIELINFANAAGGPILIATGPTPAQSTAYLQSQVTAGARFPSASFGGLLFTSDQDGYFYIPQMAGVSVTTPRTLPNQFANTTPLYYDTTHSQLMCWNGAAWAACDPTGGSGTVTVVTATAPLFITSTPTTTPNVVGHDLIFGGASTTGGQNLGSISTAPLGCVTSGGDCVVDGLTLAGGLHFDTGTGTETLANFTCSAGQAVNAASTGGGLACTPIQAPLTCGTDYLSLTCVSGGDLGGTNTTPTVIGVENDAAMRGDLLATEVATPGSPAAGKVRVFASTSDNIAAIDPSGNVNHGARDATSTTGVALTGLAANGSWTTQTFQAPLVACTDYVSIGCQAAGTDIANTNAQVHVSAFHESGGARRPFGSVAAPGTALVWDGTSVAGWLPLGDLSNDYTAPWVVAMHDGGAVQHTTTGTWATGQLIQTDGSGHLAAGGASCANLPAFGGDLASAGGTCSVQVQAIEETSGPTRLAINAIPDLGAGNNAILVRPGGTATVTGISACSALPTGTCGSTTTYGSTGAYLSQVSIDSTLRVASVTTTSTPLAGGLVYTIASTSLAMGYNQSTLTMPLPAGAPVINTAAAGTSVATTLAANWGSSVQSPPTFALNSLGSVRCSGDITNYFITGVGSETLVTALYYVTIAPATPSNWQVIASGTTTLSGSGAFFRGIGFAASSPTGLIPTNTSSIVLVMYRSDAGSGSTLTTLNANIACELGS